MQNLIATNNWQGLVEAKQFEPDKALMSLEAVSNSFLKSMKHKTVHDVFAQPTATLATVKKYRGEAKMLAVVEHMLKTVAAFLSIGRGMNEIQVSQTAQMIFYEYYFLTVADLNVCFRAGMTGKYGQLYDRLDGMIIFNWLETYANERAQYAERESVRKMQAEQANEKAMYMPEWLSKKLAEMTAKQKQPFVCNASGQKFATLEAFLVSIEHADNESKLMLLEKWESEFLQKSPDMELDAFLMYKSNQLLYMVNTGQVSNWGEVQNTI